jgi:transposase-like protein
MGFNEELDLADMTGGNSRIGNQIPPGQIVRPAFVELQTGPAGAALCWTNLTAPCDWVTPPNDLVHSFTELADATPAKILKFAKRYGVLGLDREANMPEAPNIVEGIEPIEFWKSLAARVRSILRLGARVENAEDIRPEEVAAVSQYLMNALSAGPPMKSTLPHDPPSEWFWNGKPFPTKRDARARIARTCLDWELAAWLQKFSSTLAPTRNRKSGEIEIELSYRFGLLSVIALQLLQAIARRAVYICSACKHPFVRAGGSNDERKPKASYERFCDNCGRHAAVRKADERRRDRIKEARRRFDAGESPSDIAEQLRIRSAETVRKWIEKGK